MSAPDLIGHHVGYRYWRPGPEGVLMALRTPMLWPALRPLEALCLMPPLARGADHGAAPSLGCSCGCYAFTIAHMERYGLELETVQPVVGRVALWGTVVESEWGFRAQYATPIDLAVIAPFITRAVPGPRRGLLRRRASGRIEADLAGARLLADQLAVRYEVPVRLLRTHAIADFVASPVPAPPAWAYPASLAA